MHKVPDEVDETMLKALRDAETPDEIRRYSRALVRKIEVLVVHASDLAAHLVDAIGVR